MTREEERDLLSVVLLQFWCWLDGRDVGRLVWSQQVCRLDSFDGHSVLRAVSVNGDSLPGPSQDKVGSLVGLRQRPADGIHAYEDMGAGVEVLVHEGLHQGRARLLMAPLRREAKSWALQGAGLGVVTRNLPGSLRLMP